MTRNWKKYEEELVERGEFCLTLDFLENWDDELEGMNEGKVACHPLLRLDERKGAKEDEQTKGRG